jgi:hypothetical protein|tara:strand:+ start:9523 stop:9966 length:444 start_codon:yes stop_codon:yes gene_type:complete
MDTHLFILSTMSPALTNAALPNFDFDTKAGTIQKFKLDNQTTIWIACQHPVINCLAESIVPYMDACVCWYHDHCTLSCLRVQNCMTFLQKYHQNISLMTTIKPALLYRHHSKIKKYYNNHGFQRKHYLKDFIINVQNIILDSKLSRF